MRISAEPRVDTKAFLALRPFVNTFARERTKLAQAETFCGRVLSIEERHDGFWVSRQAVTPEGARSAERTIRGVVVRWACMKYMQDCPNFG